MNIYVSAFIIDTNRRDIATFLVNKLFPNKCVINLMELMTEK